MVKLQRPLSNSATLLKAKINESYAARNEAWERISKAVAACQPRSPDALELGWVNLAA